MSSLTSDDLKLAQTAQRDSASRRRKPGLQRNAASFRAAGAGAGLSLRRKPELLLGSLAHPLRRVRLKCRPENCVQALQIARMMYRNTQQRPDPRGRTKSAQQKTGVTVGTDAGLGLVPGWELRDCRLACAAKVSPV